MAESSSQATILKGGSCCKIVVMCNCNGLGNEKGAGQKGNTSSSSNYVEGLEKLDKSVKIFCSYDGRVKIGGNTYDEAGYVKISASYDEVGYVNGETRIFYVDRGISFQNFKKKLSSLSNRTKIDYYLPGHGLISVYSEEDLESMMREYDEMNFEGQGLRVFLSESPRTYGRV